MFAKLTELKKEAEREGRFGDASVYEHLKNRELMGIKYGMPNYVLWRGDEIYKKYGELLETLKDDYADDSELFMEEVDSDREYSDYEKEGDYELKNSMINPLSNLRARDIQDEEEKEEIDYASLTPWQRRKLKEIRDREDQERLLHPKLPVFQQAYNEALNFNKNIAGKRSSVKINNDKILDKLPYEGDNLVSTINFEIEDKDGEFSQKTFTSIIDQTRIPGEAAFNTTDYMDEYIPPMSAQDKQKLKYISKQHVEHQEELRREAGIDEPVNKKPKINERFEDPISEDNRLILNNGEEYQLLPNIPLDAPLEFAFKKIMEVADNIIVHISNANKGFNNSYMVIDCFLNSDTLRESGIEENGRVLAFCVGSIVEVVMRQFYHSNPNTDVKFKVEVAFSCVLKKLQKLENDTTGKWDYRTFIKNSMLMKDGRIISFNNPVNGFRCAFNTTIDVINECLDVLNAPDLDSSWQFCTVRSVRITLYAFTDLKVFGNGYTKIPANIQGKKACINPLCEKGCFWQAIKICLVYEYCTKKERNNLCRVKHCKEMWKKYKDKVNIKINKGDLPRDSVPCDEKVFKKFSELNKDNNLAFGVFLPENNKDYPLRPFYTDENDSLTAKKVKLLFISPKECNAETGHYIAIVNHDKFLFNVGGKHHKKILCERCHKCHIACRGPCIYQKIANKAKETNTYLCEKCMAIFNSKEKFLNHGHMCLIVDKNYRVIQLPTERKYLEFEGDNSDICTYMVADFESCLIPLNEKKEGTKMTIVNKHVPCSYGIKVISIYKELEEFILYTGKDPDDTMKHFCNDILRISKKVYEKYALHAPMIELNEQEQHNFDTATECYICHKEFYHGDKRCRDHDHITGKYLGCACNACNLKRTLTNMYLPLIFHNARGYDIHHVVREITKPEYNCHFQGIAQNSEKIMSFTIKQSDIVENEEGRPSTVKLMCDIRIIDSLLFLLKSLESLTEILKKKCNTEWNYESAFPILYKEQAKRGLTEGQIFVSLQKNLYPYLWFDSFEKFDKPIKDLIDLVYERKCEYFTDEPDETFKSLFELKIPYFEQVIQAFPEFKTVKDYADLYLSNDVLQLSDIIENARNTLRKTHHLDILRYYGAPGYSWDAFLYSIQAKKCAPIYFMGSEMDKLCFFMHCVRGGCSGIMKRYAKANNKFLGDRYDPSLPSSFILYLDANNLYGWAMRQKLPYDEFQWINNYDLERLNRDPNKNIIEFLGKLEAFSKNVYFEVDIDYPSELHYSHNLYPLAPERRCVKEEEISTFSRELNDRLHVRVNTKTPMLMQTLEDKKHYFVHGDNLKLYIELGMEVRKIHSGLMFKEDYIMRDYIDLNTELRNRPGGTDFDKELYKLMNNSIYGKTLENPLKYCMLYFISTESKYNKTVRDPGFEGSVFSQGDFMIAKLKHKTVKYEKCPYLGATVTERAKWLMYNFYYNVLQKYYGWEKVNLLFTDTDSLMLEIFTDDIYKDISDINDKFDCPIDVSTFSPEIVTRYGISKKGNKVIGKFKSETGSELISEFVGLRSKMYSYLIYGSESIPHIRAKGVAKSSLNQISHEHYKRCLFNYLDPEEARQNVQAKGIRAKAHELMSVKTEKVSLSCNDTKRYITSNNIDTLAYGHFKIKQLENLINHKK